MNEQPFDLRASLSALRRKKVAILIVGLLGLGLGLLNAAAHRPAPTAVAQVVLPAQPSGSDNPTYAQTQATIASSDAVRLPAIGSVRPPVRADQVRVTVTTSSNSVLNIRARAPHAGQAKALANAVATNYISAAQNHKFVTGTPQLIQAAAITGSPSFVSGAVKDGLIGLLAGLFLATVIVLVRAQRDHRLRRRDQIARAIGVPVLAAIQSAQYKTASQWRRLLEHFGPSNSTAWNLRKVLTYFVPGDLEDDLTICVAAFAEDGPALAAGPQLALAATAFGLPADLHPSDQDILAPLRAACATLPKAGRLGQIVELGRDDDPWKRVWDTADRRVVKGSELEVTVVALDRTRPELSPFMGRLVLAVSAGFPVTDDLAGVALAATEQGLKIDGILLVNPEPGDSSIGMIPDRDEELWGGRRPDSRSSNQPSNGAAHIGRAG